MVVQKHSRDIGIQWARDRLELLHLMALDLAYCVQVSTYAFTFPDESQGGMQIRMLLPLLDLMNHGNEGAAAFSSACVGSRRGSTCLHARPV